MLGCLRMLREMQWKFPKHHCFSLKIPATSFCSFIYKPELFSSTPPSWIFCLFFPPIVPFNPDSSPSPKFRPCLVSSFFLHHPVSLLDLPPSLLFPPLFAPVTAPLVLHVLGVFHPLHIGCMSS